MYSFYLERDFVERTMHILEHYDGPYGVTLLVNCLLGLIVLPKEKDFNHISNRDHLHFFDLGIDEHSCVRSWGKVEESERTAARFLRSLRNSVAHLQIEGLCENGEIESLRFLDNTGFEAVFQIEELKTILFRLADHILKDG